MVCDQWLVIADCWVLLKEFSQGRITWSRECGNLGDMKKAES